jgi:hypothetical protein
MHLRKRHTKRSPNCNKTERYQKGFCDQSVQFEKEKVGYKRMGMSKRGVERDKEMVSLVLQTDGWLGGKAAEYFSS